MFDVVVGLGWAQRLFNLPVYAVNREEERIYIDDMTSIIKYADGYSTGGKISIKFILCFPAND